MGTAVRVLLALGAVYLIFKVGLGLLKGFARPLPEPPPPGEMRRVKLRYRCSLCGMELRVDRALSEDPVAPRHCMEDMDVVAPVE
ncbi:MAG: hypothetical protein M3R01_05775 [Actinomycetota bacterium]|nr:hypothetical protein [Acidimicrobiia bacterium]MDQ3146429.1 hypothetical protein [Actinomycetota bacterium]